MMKRILSVIVLGACPLLALAQSQAASVHASAAVQASDRAFAESAAAGVSSAAAAFRLTSAVAAVPLWMSGRAVASAGAVVTASGKAVQAAGAGSAAAAQGLWDFSSGADSTRPHLDPEIGLPRATRAGTGDPSPAEAMNVKAQ